MTVAAELVKDIRAAAALTQGELARRSGIAQPAISDYERGTKVPSLPTLEKLAEAADVSLAISIRPRRQPMLSHMERLTRNRRTIHRICATHGASNPRIVGSVARGTAGPDSDIDLVVDMERGRTLLDVAALHDDLVDLLDTEVDVITSGAVHGALANILDAAIPL